MQARTGSEDESSMDFFEEEEGEEEEEEEKEEEEEDFDEEDDDDVEEDVWEFSLFARTERTYDDKKSCRDAVAAYCAQEVTN